MDKIDFVILWVDGFRSGMAAAEREYFSAPEDNNGDG